ncbi:hypothetical protein V6U90_07915 [Micromonospora sp. CPCC 206060]|uniref:hypothetical protein n=1 Tax=Micromonospora sp. CPCC 206060 TaxID=3122406 RepID=UPI002FF2C3A9
MLSLWSGVQPPTLTGAARQAAIDRLARLSQVINGTPGQRSAGEILLYHAYQDPVRDCLARTGLSYPTLPFADPYAGSKSLPVDGGLWLTPLTPQTLGLADPERFALSAAQQAEQDAISSAYERLDPAARRRYDEAVIACPAPHGVGEIHFPPSWVPLNSAYQEVLTRVAKDWRVRAAGRSYPDCMRADGFPVSTYGELIELIGARIGPASLPGYGGVGGPAWSAVVEQERAAARADARCRRTAYEVALAVVAPELVRFERRYANGLARVAGEWAAMVDRARAYPEGRCCLR